MAACGSPLVADDGAVMRLSPRRNLAILTALPTRSYARLCTGSPRLCKARVVEHDAARRVSDAPRSRLSPTAPRFEADPFGLGLSSRRPTKTAAPPLRA